MSRQIGDGGHSLHLIHQFFKPLPDIVVFIMELPVLDRFDEVALPQRKRDPMRRKQFQHFIADTECVTDRFPVDALIFLGEKRPLAVIVEDLLHTAPCFFDAACILEFSAADFIDFPG